MQKHSITPSLHHGIKYCSAVVLLCCSVVVLFVSPVSAQQVSLSISPPLLEVFAKPGKSVLVAYTIENKGDPVIMQAKVLPFEPIGTQGRIAIKDEYEGPIQFALDNADLQLEQPYFLRTQASQQLLLRIRIPEGAPEGDYYYTLLNETQPPPTSEGVVAPRAKATIGTNILITVTESGKVDVKGKIAIFDIMSQTILPFIKKFKVFDSSQHIPVVLVVENRGKNVIKPEGEIVMKGNFGEKATYTIVPQNILKESQRQLRATPSAEIDCAEKKNEKLCASSPTLILSGFFLGKYSLSTTIHFGEGSPNLYAATSFYAIPIKFIIAFIVALSIVIFMIRRMKKTDEE